jgi:10 TM Acyl Transferase domain found in Cas1p
MEDPAQLISTQASAVFFGAIIFVTVALTCQSLLARRLETLCASFTSVLCSTDNDHCASDEKGSLVLDWKSQWTIYTISMQLSVVGVVLFYCYICEFQPPSFPADKDYDADEFYSMLAIFAAMSCFHTSQASYTRLGSPTSAQVGAGDCDVGILAYSQHSLRQDDHLLSREQTDEWKGWMQVVLLLSHYFNATAADKRIDYLHNWTIACCK